MGSTKRKTREQFINEANIIHSNKYTYERCNYINNRTPVIITCPTHGDFEQIPKLHLRGSGCPHCGKEILRKKRNHYSQKDNSRRKQIAKGSADKKYCGSKPKNTDEFIKLANEIHKNKYDYSKTVYKNNSTKVTITCHKHGDFTTTPRQHLSGYGCRYCAHETSSLKQKFTNEEFIGFLKEIYGDEYDYSLVDYDGQATKVKLICHKKDSDTGEEHGIFEKRANDLLHKKTGCPKCYSEKRKKIFSSTKEDFIKKANEIFHDTYDYSDVIYVNNSTKVKIGCRKHGIFLCTPQNHLHGRGCPICKSESYVYEERMYNFLKTIFNEEDIVRQYRTKWLSNNKSIDFFIRKYNIGIEHQGSQHYYLTRYEGDNEEKLNKRIENDKIKHKECLENGVRLLYFSYELKTKPDNCFHELIFDEKELGDIINKITKRNE